MPKKPRIRTLMDTQHLKGSETLQKSARQYFHHIFWSLWKKISSKISVLVVSVLLRLFVQILTPDDKYSLTVKASVSWNQFKCYYLQTKKYFLNILLNFGNLHKILTTWKKLWASEVICFWNYRLQKAGLLKCPKSRISEHLWTVNMLNGPKHCQNLHGSIFVRYFDHSERKSRRKSLF